MLTCRLVNRYNRSLFRSFCTPKSFEGTCPNTINRFNINPQIVESTPKFHKNEILCKVVNQAVFLSKRFIFFFFLTLSLLSLSIPNTILSFYHYIFDKHDQKIINVE